MSSWRNSGKNREDWDNYLMFFVNIFTKIRGFIFQNSSALPVMNQILLYPFISIFNSMNCLFLQVCLFLPCVFPHAFVLSSCLGELVRAELKTEAGFRCNWEGLVSKSGGNKHFSGCSNVDLIWKG